MNISKMNRLDLNLKLLAGATLNVENISIRPKTVREVIEIGHSLYMGYLSIITAKVEDFLGKDFKNNEDITILDCILYSKNEELISSLVECLAFFLDENVDECTYLEDAGLVFGSFESSKIDDLKIVSNKNIYEIANIIMYQNCVKYPSDKDTWNAKDEKARKIIEKLEANRKKVAQAKKNDGNGGDDIDFHSIISAVTAKSNSISKFNVWDLNIYQLYDEFKRIEMIDGYETSIMAMMQGASIKDLKHWSIKMEV